LKQGNFESDDTAAPSFDIVFLVTDEPELPVRLMLRAVGEAEPSLRQLFKFPFALGIARTLRRPPTCCGLFSAVLCVV
jgi:hypothetical protein